MTVYTYHSKIKLLDLDQKFFESLLILRLVDPRQHLLDIESLLFPQKRSEHLAPILLKYVFTSSHNVDLHQQLQSQNILTIILEILVQILCIFSQTLS